MGRRVLVIGLDGATFDLIKPWADEGKLPTFMRLLEEGAHGILLSTHQSNSAQAWSTIITGMNAGRHGIFDFIDPIPGSYRIRYVNASLRAGKSLWKRLSEAGKRVGVINVPITYPAEEINGFLIPGLDAPGMDGECTYPRGLLAEVERAVGGYILEPGVWGFIRRGRRDLAINKMYESVQKRLEAAKYLMRSRPWDFFMVLFAETDRVQHHFWKFINPRHPNYDPNGAKTFGGAIYSIYQRLDTAVAELIAGADKDVVTLVFSDHGAGPSSQRTFYINRWLNHEGYLAFTPSSAKGGLVQGRDWLLAKAHLALNRALSRPMKERLLRHFPGVRNRVSSALYLAGIDWKATRAYSRENAPTICVNVRGREPQGTVEPGAEYERLRDEIVEKLLELRCPESGVPIVAQVYRREELYEGPYLTRAPDLLIEWKDHAYIQRPGYTGKGQSYIEILTDRELEWAETVSRPSGIHRREGIFVALGEPVLEGKELRGHHLVDIAPTVLYLTGSPIPRSMDGHVIDEMMDRDFVRANPPNYVDEPVEEGYEGPGNGGRLEESRVIEERLRGLGYID
jgi:predicted AlkP superfamily phosphohydrolase/phosphomutase